MRKALDDPAYDADVNIAGTIAVLEAAREVGARVVFASTGGAGYGEYAELPIPTPETEETRPLSHYGMSKMAGEGYLGLYGRLYGLETVALRLGNVYGPRQDPHGEAGVVAIFCGCLLDDKRPKVFGTGAQTRDYVYVGDVARAFMLAERGPAGHVVNVGCAREVSVLDLLKGLGYADQPVLAPPRAGEIQRSALDNAKAARLWGWRPEVALEDGLRITYEAIATARRAPDSRPAGAFRGGPSRGGFTASPAITWRGPSSTIQLRSSGVVFSASAAAARPSPSTGGRQPVEWASDARKCAVPSRRRAAAARRAATPFSPVTLAAVIWTRAPRPTMSRMRSGARCTASARSGWAITAPAAHLQVAQDLGKPQRPATEGHLKKEPPLAGTAERGGEKVVVAHPGKEVERDLPAGAHLDGNAGLVEMRAQPGNPLGHLRGGGGVAPQHVGGGHDGAGARVPRQPRHVQRCRGRGGPVVDTGEEMAVKVDHGVTAYPPVNSRRGCASIVAPWGYSSAGRAPGSHPGGQRFEPA